MAPPELAAEFPAKVQLISEIGNDVWMAPPLSSALLPVKMHPSKVTFEEDVELPQTLTAEPEVPETNVADQHPYGEDSFRGDNPPAGFDIKGNEDSMKFHEPSSPWYGRTIAEVWFRSAAAAEAAGFVNAVKSDSEKEDAK